MWGELVMNTNRMIWGITGTLVSFTGCTLDNVNNIVSIICGILGVVITVISCVVVPVWKKIREAMKDKKIDPDELQDITDTLKDGIDKLNGKDKK